MKKMALGVKLQLGFLICSILLVGVGAYSLYSIKEIEIDYKMIVDRNFPKSIAAEEMKNVADKSISLVLHINQAEQTQSEKNRLEKKYYAEIELFEKIKKEYENQKFEASERKIYDVFEKDWLIVKKSMRWIGKQLGRSASSISREIRRNSIK